MLFLRKIIHIGPVGRGYGFFYQIGEIRFQILFYRSLLLIDLPTYVIGLGIVQSRLVVCGAEGHVALD